MNLTAWQRIAIEEPALLAQECLYPRNAHLTATGSVVLSVNAGYE